MPQSIHVMSVFYLYSTCSTPTSYSSVLLAVHLHCALCVLVFLVLRVRFVLAHICSYCLVDGIRRLFFLFAFFEIEDINTGKSFYAPLLGYVDDSLCKSYSATGHNKSMSKNKCYYVYVYIGIVTVTP